MNVDDTQSVAMMKQGRGAALRGPRRGPAAACVATLAMLATLALGPASAHATKASQTCDRVQSDVIEIDGMVDDWQDVGRRKVGGSNSNLSYDLRCAYDDSTFYAMVNVRDQVIVRRKAARLRGEDGVKLVLRASDRGRPLTLSLFPGMGKRKPVRRLGARRLPSWIKAEDSLQKRGYSVEVAIPLKRIPGWGRNATAFPATVTVFDADRAGRARKALRYNVTLRSSDGVAVHRSFMRSARLRDRDIRVDRMVNMDGVRGAERLIAGGTAIGVLGRRYAFMRLPVQSPTDVYSVKPVDLFGTGRSVIVAHYAQRGHGGTREAVGIWKINASGQFTRVLAFEVKKISGANELPNTWRLVRKGTLRRKRLKRGRGFDILVEAGKPKGWDEDSYEETPATDIRPILLPWEDKTAVLYTFDGGVAAAETPRTTPKRRKRRKRR